MHELWKRTVWVGIFAFVMAYLEAAAVIYLRIIYGVGDLVKVLSGQDPIIRLVEIGREFATILMLVSVAWIAGRFFRERSAFFIFTFGIWDIFYYFWLKVLIGWPSSVFDTDLLFLIPFPWWSPVVAPIMISLLMVAAGIYLISEKKEKLRFSPLHGTGLVTGILLMLFAFMRDAVTALLGGIESFAIANPTAFNWWLFLPGFFISASIVFALFMHSLKDRQG